MQIITGYTGTPHITSAQDRAENMGTFGTGSYILNVGNKLAATVQSSTEVRISDGIVSNQGCLGIIETGSYDSLAITPGTSGMQRRDYIVARYIRDAETNVESLTLMVLEGTPASSSPANPSYYSGSIAGGDSPVDAVLYRLNYNGVNTPTITQVASSVRTQAETDSLIGSSSISNVKSTITGAIGNTALGTTATTLSGAIAEHESDINTVNSKMSAVETANNSTIGLTVRLYYQKSCPNIMLLKITGTTTSQMSTAAGYANVWNANNFITAACGARSATITKYIVMGAYKIQIQIESGGLIKIGYSTKISDNTTTDIPSGTSFYVEEMVFFK